MEPFQWAQEYQGEGIPVVPLVPGNKCPAHAGWQERRFTWGDFPTGLNIGLNLGEASGGLVAIDLDKEEAVQLAPDFLPATGMKFGRNGVARH
jgi:hypothetical protein